MEKINGLYFLILEFIDFKDTLNFKATCKRYYNDNRILTHYNQRLPLSILNKHFKKTLNHKNYCSKNICKGSLEIIFDCIPTYDKVWLFYYKYFSRVIENVTSLKFSVNYKFVRAPVIKVYLAFQNVVSNLIFGMIKNCSNLKKLKFKKTFFLNVSKWNSIHWRNYDNIKTLVLNGLTNIDDNILFLIGSNIKNLKNFSMGGTTKVTDDGMEFLLKNTRLVKFKIYACMSITDDSFVYLKNHTQLKVLYMDFCKSITNFSLYEIFRNCNKIEKLSMNQTFVNNDTIVTCAIHLPKIKELYVDYCQYVTFKSLSSIRNQKYFRNLQKFSKQKITY